MKNKQRTTREKFMQKTRDAYRNMAVRANPRPLQFSLEQFRDWLMPQVEAGLHCEYSGSYLPLDKAVFDHRIPLTRSGPCTLDNISICSDIENRRKGELTGEEWQFLRRGILTMPEAAQRNIYERLGSNSAKVRQMLMMRLLEKRPPTKKSVGKQPPQKKREAQHGQLLF